MRRTRFDVEYVVMVERMIGMSDDPNDDLERITLMSVAFRGEVSKDMAEHCYYVVGKLIKEVPDYPSHMQVDDMLGDVTDNDQRSHIYYGLVHVYDEDKHELITVSIHRQYAASSAL